MRRFHYGFSLIEVVIALGIISFALLSTLALLPMGIKTNRISAEETRATCILTSVEADLRNTHPLANNGNSKYFGLALPYTTNSSGQIILNTNLSTNTVSSTNSVGLDENENASNVATKPPLPYQVTILYTQVPAPGSLSPIEARLIVGWPCRATTDPVALTSLTNISGFVESYVSFPAP